MATKEFIANYVKCLLPAVVKPKTIRIAADALELGGQDVGCDRALVVCLRLHSATRIEREGTIKNPVALEAYSTLAGLEIKKANGLTPSEEALIITYPNNI